MITIIIPLCTLGSINFIAQRLVGPSIQREQINQNKDKITRVENLKWPEASLCTGIPPPSGKNWDRRRL